MIKFQRKRGAVVARLVDCVIAAVISTGAAVFLWRLMRDYPVLWAMLNGLSLVALPILIMHSISRIRDGLEKR